MGDHIIFLVTSATINGSVFCKTCNDNIVSSGIDFPSFSENFFGILDSNPDTIQCKLNYTVIFRIMILILEKDE